MQANVQEDGHASFAVGDICSLARSAFLGVFGCPVWVGEQSGQTLSLFASDLGLSSSFLHADNGSALHAAKRGSLLGVLRSFISSRTSKYNLYSGFLGRIAKCLPDYPSQLFTSKKAVCQWLTTFVNWYTRRHGHSGIQFVMHHQHHSGQAVEICRHRSVVCGQARQQKSHRWSRSTRCWH